MARGAFRLNTVAMTSVLLAMLAPAATAQRHVPGGIGSTRPGAGAEEPGVTIMPRPGSRPGLPPPTSMLGVRATPEMVSGTVVRRIGDARVEFPVVVRPGETIGNATAVGVVNGMSRPIGVVAVNAIVLGFNEPTTLAQAEAFLRQRGVTGPIRPLRGLPNMFHAEVATAVDAFLASDAFADDPAIHFIEPEMYFATTSAAPEVGLAQGAMSIANGATYDFGTTTIGTPVDAIFTITNTGDMTLLLDPPDVPAGFNLTVPLSDNSLDPMETATFTVRFLAQAAGVTTGTVEILNNGTTNPFSFTVEGTVMALMGNAEIQVAIGADAVVNGGTVNFGATSAGMPVSRTFTITNAGADPLSIGTINLPAGFSVTTEPESPLGSGDSTTLVVQLDAAADGTYGGALSFLTNDPDDNPFAITLAGVVFTSSGAGIDDPLFPAQWHLTNTGQNGGVPFIDVNAEAAWAITQGLTAVVAVLDNGSQPDHPDYAGNVGACEDCVNFFDLAENIDGGGEPGGHGTAVAGLIAANANSTGVRGVAPQAQLILTSFLTPVGDPMSNADIAENIAAAAEAGAAVHSNSWGPGRAVPMPALIRIAIENLSVNARDGKGMLFVVATGNFNELVPYNNPMAFLEPVLGVGAVDNLGRRSRFGSPVFGSGYGLGLSLVGPSNGGTLGITTTDVSDQGGYNTAPSANGGDYTSDFSGTSAATPIVAGVAALTVAVNNNLHASQIKRILQHTARENLSRLDLFIPEAARLNVSTGFSESFGYGIPDAAAAVAAAQRAAAESGLTWPAPPTEVEVVQGANSTSITWQNAPVGPTGEYAGVLLARAPGPFWRPVDGVTYTEGQTPAEGVKILGVGDFGAFVDEEVTRLHNATYLVFTRNERDRYSFAAVGQAVRNEVGLVFNDSFETANGWIATGEWERGSPQINFLIAEVAVGPNEVETVVYDTPNRLLGYNIPRSGASVFATDLDGTYTSNTEHMLISPVIDLTDANLTSASLTYFELLEIESFNPNESIRVEVIEPDLEKPTVIRVLREGNPGNTYEWRPIHHNLSSEIGRSFRLRFTLTADVAPVGVLGAYQGWLLDALRVTVSGGDGPLGPPRRPGLIVLPPIGGFLFPGGFPEGAASVPAGPLPFGAAPPAGTVLVEASPDVNQDGRIDFTDLNEVLSRFGSREGDRTYRPGYDFNADGEVGLFDLSIMLIAVSNPAAYTPVEFQMD